MRVPLWFAHVSPAAAAAQHLTRAPTAPWLPGGTRLARSTATAARGTTHSVRAEGRRPTQRPRFPPREATARRAKGVAPSTRLRHLAIATLSARHSMTVSEASGIGFPPRRVLELIATRTSLTPVWLAGCDDYQAACVAPPSSTTSADASTTTDAVTSATGTTTTQVSTTVVADTCGLGFDNRCGNYDAEKTCQCDVQCEAAGDCCTDYKNVCLGDIVDTEDWSGPPAGTTVPLNCAKGKVTVNGACVSYEWDFAPDEQYHHLPEPLAETSGAVVGDLLVVFGDGNWLGNTFPVTAETTKKTFVYNFKTKEWDSNRARRPHWGDHQSVEVSRGRRA